MRRTKNGYRTVAVGHAGEVYEHVVIAARALGKPLPKGAEVHHVDENTANNANANLVICHDRAYHKLLHKRARIVRAGGNPNTQRICSGCRAVKALAEFNRRASDYQTACRACQKSYQDERRAA